MVEMGVKQIPRGTFYYFWNVFVVPSWEINIPKVRSGEESQKMTIDSTGKT